MADWADNWVKQRRERTGVSEDAASDSGAVVDPDETIEDVNCESDTDSDATIPDPDFLDGYWSGDDAVGAYSELDQILERKGISMRRPL
ncbi:hypothetical protein TWF718_006791 [Orbilia javanica]|uniref:Uncharacterized protein n=1 Tax=Orbilia javanica TaxID=47235 RepID=A0AAN8MNH9_9PEZI